VIVASKAVEKQSRAEVSTVDPRDEPSARWGWHGSFPKASMVAGWFTVAALLLMLIGNHENNTENVWLICLAAGVAIALILDMRKRRTSWRR
jgi:hypothetical protein